MPLIVRDGKGNPLPRNPVVTPDVTCKETDFIEKVAEILKIDVKQLKNITDVGCFVGRNETPEQFAAGLLFEVVYSFAVPEEIKETLLTNTELTDAEINKILLCRVSSI